MASGQPSPFNLKLQVPQLASTSYTFFFLSSFIGLGCSCALHMAQIKRAISNIGVFILVGFRIL
jgi:hypothetical protein